MAERLKGGTGRRRVDNTVRNLLLTEHRKRFGPGSRWHWPGAPVSEYETALVSAAAVVVDSGTLMCALLHAGLPCDDYAYGGTHWGKQFLLDVDGTLTEWTAEDQAAVDPDTLC